VAIWFPDQRKAMGILPPGFHWSTVFLLAPLLAPLEVEGLWFGFLYTFFVGILFTNSLNQQSTIRQHEFHRISTANHRRCEKVV
jgi:hypothetical protein